MVAAVRGVGVRRSERLPTRRPPRWWPRVERLLRACNRAGLQGPECRRLRHRPGRGSARPCLAAGRRRPQVTIVSPQQRGAGRASVAAMCQARFGAMIRGRLLRATRRQEKTLDARRLPRVAVVRQSGGCGCSVATSWPRARELLVGGRRERGAAGGELKASARWTRGKPLGGPDRAARARPSGALAIGKRQIQGAAGSCSRKMRSSGSPRVPGFSRRLRTGSRN